VVELSDATPDPEAMMVELSHALVAVPAVSTTIRLHDFTSIAEALRRQLYFLHYRGKQTRLDVMKRK